MPQAYRPVARLSAQEATKPAKSTIWDVIKDRLCEMSTWRALIRIAAAFGVFSMTPDQEEALLAMATLIAGTGGLLPDRIKP
jgi:hypothetical protein